MDIIYIHDLKIETVIGVFEWERRIKQTVSIDLEMATDNRKAAQSDAIDHALDYNALAQRVTALVEASSFHLIETLAERIAETLLTEFAIPWLRLRLNKPGAVKGAKNVGVLIERDHKA